jgi:hypothetical protein
MPRLGERYLLQGCHEGSFRRLSELGRREEALSVATEAVTIRRELTRGHPEAFTPDLA